MPTEDGFRRFRGECPGCGLELNEWMERCPACGQNLFEVYSGTWRPPRSICARIVAVLLLLILLGSLGIGLWQSCAGFQHRRAGPVSPEPGHSAQNDSA
jgi:hypothetical protein